MFYADPSFKIIMTTELCEKDDIFQYQTESGVEYWVATGASKKITINNSEVEYAEFTKKTNLS